MLKKLTISLTILFLSIGCSYSQTESSLFPNEELRELEKAFVNEITKSPIFNRNPLINAYINHLGHSLTKKPSRYHFYIIKSDEINAFAAPGGHIVINTGLILKTKSEDELASVMAHEIAHVRQNHLLNLIKLNKRMTWPRIGAILASIALGAINPSLGAGALIASNSGFAQQQINFTRHQETEADRIGIKLLASAGYNPESMANFFKTLQKNSRYYAFDNIPEILKTHPLDESRISEAQNIASQLKVKKPRKSTYYEYVKSTLRVQSLSKVDLLTLTPPKKLNQIKIYEFAFIYHLLGREKLARLFIQKIMYRDNLFIKILASDIENKIDKKKSLSILENLYEDTPENWAITAIYAKRLLEVNNHKKAQNILQKAYYQYPKNNAICYFLAKVQSMNKLKAQAYLTLANCLDFEGAKLAALEQLNNAKKNTKNKLLLLQIKSKLSELKDS